MKPGKNKIFRKSKVCKESSRSEDLELDSVAWEKSQYGDRRAFDVLMEAKAYWDNMSQFRRDRERAKKYTFGQQWDDIVCVDGKRMTEKEYIKEQGNVPLTNNHIHKFVKQFLGVYRSQSKEPTCYARDRKEQVLGETMTTALQYVMQRNQMQEVNAQTMEEFLIGGLAVQRKWYGYRNGTEDCWTDYVNPNSFFIDNNMRDIRGWDVSCIGEVHEISLRDLLSKFANNNEDVRKLRQIYTNARDRETLVAYGAQFGKTQYRNLDFLYAEDPGMCKVVEVWRKESKPRYRCRDYNKGELFKIEIEDKAKLVDAVNADRIERGLSAGIPEEDIPLIECEWFMDSYWYYYYLSPFGDILREGETPYDHGCHPYVFKAYPFIDGEIHSFVSDIIDQQRYVNRLVTMHDWIMRASAKGVLMFPADCVPDDMDMDEIADEWSRFNGVIVYKAKQGVPAPAQIANNSTNIGISELLSLQLKFFEDISGINGALQGKSGFAGTSAAKYNQETQNATLSLLDLLERFSAFVKDGALKDVKNIQQFYTTKKMVGIVGTNSSVEYDPEKIGDIEFDLAIMESTMTPAYRQMSNDILMELFRTGVINGELLLEHCDYPFADSVLQSLQAQKEQLERGEMPKNVAPEVAKQVEANANQQAVNALYQNMR